MTQLVDNNDINIGDLVTFPGTETYYIVVAIYYQASLCLLTLFHVDAASTFNCFNNSFMSMVMPFKDVIGV